MDLTPSAPAPLRRRSRLAYVVLAVVLVALGVVVYQALSSASLYFYNADEAVEQQSELGHDRFRLQGLVRGGFDEDAEPLEFMVTFNGADVLVRHDGSPPELFEVGMPVVLEGRWSDDFARFDSDRILVKHSEEYEADNEDRLDDARDGRSGDTGDAPTEP